MQRSREPWRVWSSLSLVWVSLDVGIPDIPAVGQCAGVWGLRGGTGDSRSHAEVGSGQETWGEIYFWEDESAGRMRNCR